MLELEHIFMILTKCHSYSAIAPIISQLLLERYFQTYIQYHVELRVSQVMGTTLIHDAIVL